MTFGAQKYRELKIHFWKNKKNKKKLKAPRRVRVGVAGPSGLGLRPQAAGYPRPPGLARPGQG